MVYTNIIAYVFYNFNRVNEIFLISFCANGDILNFAYEKEETTAYGYKVKTKYYRNKRREGYPRMRKGHKSKLGFRESKTSPEFM